MRKLKSLVKSPRRIVRLSNTIITEAEAEGLREKGIIPITEGETTTLEAFRLDTKTKKQLRKIQQWYKNQGKKYTQSDLIRLALLDWIKKHEKHGALKE